MSYLNVGVAGVGEAELPCASLLLPVLVDLRVPDDGDGVAVVAQRERLLPEHVGPVVVRDGQDDAHRLVGHAVVEKAVEVLALQELPLSHET